MILDELKAKGTLTIQIFDSEGKLKEEKHEENLVVTVGRNWIASRLKDTGIPTQMTHMDIGQGATAPVAGDTTIQTPFSPSARQALSTAGGSVSGAEITYSATFPAGSGTGAVTEAAIFNASSGGTMLCRTTFGVITKGASDVMAISWKLSILAS